MEYPAVYCDAEQDATNTEDNSRCHVKQMAHKQTWLLLLGCTSQRCSGDILRACFASQGDCLPDHSTS